ncbi:MAG TPA: branched-chain amino acid ABC transporter permease [Syntrophales bacterium]|nr:branched-chain amino acid ABC transporter permease [Syntrophales bacterium]
MKKGYLALGLFLIALVVYPLYFTDPFPQHTMIMILLYATMGIGWNIIGGYTGQVSFGNAAFFGVGAYATAVLLTNYGLSPWIGMVIGCGFSVLVAVVVGYPCFRLQGHYFAIATIAVGEIALVIFTNWQYVGGAVGIYLPIRQESFWNFQFHTSKISYYYIILSMFVFGLAVCHAVERSRLGYYLRAIKDDPDGARSLGINVQKYKLYAFMLSAILTSICGTFYAMYVLYIHPSNTFDLMLSINLCILVLIGGLGKLFGPVIGAFLFIPLTELTRVHLGSEGQGVDMIIFALIIILLATLRPQGLWGIFTKRAT